MGVLFLILIAGFIKITADIIRIPATMSDSWFRKFEKNKYIDPQISWVNKGNYHMILYPILSMFGDLWHTLYSVFITIYIICIWIGFHSDYMLYLNWIWFGIISFLMHGIGVFIGYMLWRKILN